MTAETAELADLKRCFGDAIFAAESFAVYNMFLPNLPIQVLDQYLSLCAEAEERHRALKGTGAEIPENADCRMYRLRELSSVIKEARQRYLE